MRAPTDEPISSIGFLRSSAGAGVSNQRSASCLEPNSSAALTSYSDTRQARSLCSLLSEPSRAPLKR